MTWDITLPPGSEAISNGDNRIREFKTDVQTALQTYGSFPGIDPANPKYIWTISRGNTAARPASPVSGQLYNNTQTFTLERYNGATWDDINALPAAGIVTEVMLSASVAGNGLSGGVGTPLAVNVDNSTVEINADILRIKDLGVTLAKMAAVSVDENKIVSTTFSGSGAIVGGSGTKPAVQVDNSTIEINANALRVKDAGITQAKLAAAVVSQLGQNIGLIARVTTVTASAAYVDVVNVSTQGRLQGMSVVKAGGAGGNAKLIIDAVDYGDIVVGSATTGRILFGPGAATTMFQYDTSSAGTMNELMVFFRISLQVQHKSAGSNITTYVQYERAA